MHGPTGLIRIYIAPHYGANFSELKWYVREADVPGPFPKWRMQSLDKSVLTVTIRVSAARVSRPEFRSLTQIDILTPPVQSLIRVLIVAV